MKPADRVRIFLVDDHPLVREGLANLLQSSGFPVTGQAAGIQETLAHPGLPASDLAIVDLALGNECGMALIGGLRQRGMRVLAYSMHESSTVIRRALEAGADGYVTKSEAADSLLDAIRTVMEGGCFLSPRAEKAMRMVAPVDMLTGQQQQIYRLMGQGLANDEIARQLGISIRTLESYGVRILDKLGLHSIKELRRQAIRDAADSYLPDSGTGG